jgi:hypothetical protein
MVDMIQPNSDLILIAGRTPMRAEHQRLALPEVQGVGGREGQLVAKGDDGVDHPQRDAAEDELGEDLHVGSVAAVARGIHRCEAGSADSAGGDEGKPR